MLETLFGKTIEVSPLLSKAQFPILFKVFGISIIVGEAVM